MNKSRVFLSVVFVFGYILFLTAVGECQYPSAPKEKCWRGNWLWLGSGQEPPVVWMDSLRWTETYVGNWGGPMIAKSLGQMVCNAGLHEVYWDVYNKDGYALYPSRQYAGKVYNNRNSGYEFSVLDLPRLALEGAQLNALSVKLSVWWDGNECLGLVKELMGMYPGAEIVIIANGTDVEQIEGLLGRCYSEGSGVIKIIEDLKKDDVVELGKLSRKKWQELRKRYNYRGKVLFRREVILPESVGCCRVALVPEENHSLYVNGRLVARGKFIERGNALVYDILPYVRSGSNRICILVTTEDLEERKWDERFEGQGGLLVNIKIDETILGSDSQWQALPIEGKPSESELAMFCKKTEGWSAPLIQSKSRVWPRFRTKPPIWDELSEMIETEK